MSRGTEEALIQCAIAAHLGEKNIMIPIEVKIGLMRIGCQKWWRRK